MIDTSPNQNRCELDKIKKFVIGKGYNLIGEVIEFGTFTAQSTLNLSAQFPDKKIYTIDHFKGLEVTNKNVPEGSDWIESAFALGNPLYENIHSIPKTIDEVKEKLRGCSNVEMIIEDVHKLTNPSDYGISKISICNVDVDIYEPTVSALEFLTKCEWSEVFIRFDDWHGGESEYDQHERLAFSEWIEKYKYDYEITHGGYIGGVYVKR
jgi:hypothetical protein